MCTIGIDFGTTNSLVAIYRDNNVELIPNSLGKYMTPSVVSLLDDYSVIVGDAAKSRAITHPELTFRTVKRYLGSNHIYKVGKKAFSAEEIASFIFKSLKNDAENYLERDVVNAVVSVPAYFNAIQRGAVINSAKIAGLSVEIVINEPTAAALAHGIHDTKENKTFMIFDLGGGTFDISIVEYDDGLLEVRSSAGDNFLGGENFTEELIRYFCSKTGIVQSSLSLSDQSRLYKTIERAKISLSQNEHARTSIKIGSHEYTTELSVDEFLSESDVLIERLKKPVLRALYDSEIEISTIDDVILVGGATRMKFVRDFIIKTMGVFPSHKYNPDEVVAIGAAIQAGLKENNENLQDIVLSDVSPYTLGTAVAVLDNKNEVLRYKFLPIIERNTKIPASKFSTLHPIERKQKEINIDVLQGESRDPEKNVKLGELTVKVPRSAKTDDLPRIDVRYTYDINGLLEVEATSQDTGEKTTAIFKSFSLELTEQDIENSLKKVAKIKIPPREEVKNKALLFKAESLYEELLGDSRDTLEYYIHDFENALLSQDNEKIEEAYSQLEYVVNELELVF